MPSAGWDSSRVRSGRALAFVDKILSTSGESTDSETEERAQRAWEDGCCGATDENWGIVAGLRWAVPHQETIDMERMQ